ncbi:hypothetical protein B4O97_09985 [Marispirochaeta aestuarii]|uniref:FAD-dependent oxidoreductase 2 FAD-binding domain-containing protein n=1 Tax=Marispirochaeta aestuarii TaxID=1963862 RepID=A0A1Y1RYN7_9SPIO|nr:flavocytochrome c [Marispirochaeta aestuarii]ORC35058.1 hypothetical protein B4O97_09985 [Marispirochaeta aestuarii]
MQNMLFKRILLFVMVIIPFALMSCQKGTEAEVSGGSEYDVIVVGAGLAGLTSSISAAENGAEVLLLEKLAFPGGNTVLSTGIFYLGATSLQKELGIEDTPDAFYEEAMRVSGDKRDPMQTRMMADKGGEVFDWLVNHGVVFDDKVTPVMGSAFARAHQVTPSSSAMITALVESARELGVEIMFETPAAELLSDESGQVKGVRALDADGREHNFSAKSVVLAAGGFGADPDRLAEYTPEAEGVIYAGSPGTTGEMHAEALKLGAATIDLDVPWLTPTVEVNKKLLITSLVLSKGAIIVDSQGERFTNETKPYTEVSMVLIEKGEPSYYEVFDSQVKESVYKVPEYIDMGMVIEAASIEELADKMGVPVENLTGTIDRFNQVIRGEKEDEFGRDIYVKELAKAPFYFIEVKPGTIMTPGGLKIDEKCQVVKEDGSVIPGLYATGETTGGYRAYGYRGGDSLTHAAVTGKVAGRYAAE